MDFDFVLSDLRTQFPGQIVLYVNDIAKILGKSPKAIQNLIERKNLPFTVKLVGGLRCVDVYQVAQWATSNAEVANEVVTTAQVLNPVNASANSDSNAKASRARKSTGKAAVLGSVEEESAFGPMALMILKNRKAQALSMVRYVHRIYDSDAAAFMLDVLESMFYSPDQLASNFAVTLKSFSPNHFKPKADVQTRYFADKEGALDYLVVKLMQLRSSKSTSITQLTIEFGDKTIFHVVSSELDRLHLINNDVGLDLPMF
jgi:hypothetical protein